MADRQPNQDWISLGTASQLLGVDPATLRRWAAAGRVESFRTPGGHRRFSRAVVERVRSTRAPARPKLASRARAERVAAAYARRMRGPATLVPGAWAASLDDATIDVFREHGRRITGILLSILDEPEPTGTPDDGAPGSVGTPGADMGVGRPAAGMGAEAPATGTGTGGGAAAPEALHAAAHAQGSVTARSGLSLVEALTVVLALRQPLLTELSGQAGRRRLNAAETASLMTRGGNLLNRYLLAFVEGYQSEAVPEPAKPGRRRVGDAAGRGQGRASARGAIGGGADARRHGEARSTEGHS